MTKDDGVVHAYRSDPAIPEVMNVGSAYAAGTHSDQRLGWTQFSNLAHFNAHIAFCVEHTSPGLHVILPRWIGPRRLFVRLRRKWSARSYLCMPGCVPLSASPNPEAARRVEDNPQSNQPRQYSQPPTVH